MKNVLVYPNRLRYHLLLEFIHSSSLLSVPIELYIEHSVNPRFCFQLCLHTLPLNTKYCHFRRGIFLFYSLLLLYLVKIHTLLLMYFHFQKVLTVIIGHCVLLNDVSISKYFKRGPSTLKEFLLVSFIFLVSMLANPNIHIFLMVSFV